MTMGSPYICLFVVCSVISLGSTLEVECTDTGSECDKSYCTSTDLQSYVKKFCMRTCNYCSTHGTRKRKGRCSGKYTRNNCLRWSKRGYCSNYQYTKLMKKCCKKSCKAITKNTKPGKTGKRKRNSKSCRRSNGGCEHDCLMKRKEVICFCKKGYVLRRDRRTCARKKRKKRRNVKSCRRRNGGCEQNCSMKGKKVVCSCGKEFVLRSDKRTCAKKNRRFSSSKTRKCGVDKEVFPLGRIVGGTEAFPNRWSWQGGLYYDGQFMCGGALLTKDFFITAAHCVTRKDKDLFHVKLGDHQRDIKEDTEQTFSVKEVVVHDNWSPSTIVNDIALLKLTKEVHLNNQVGIVCLPTQNEMVKRSSECYITGWGKTDEYTKPSNSLQEAKMPIVSNRVCSSKNVDNYGKSRIKSTMLCAGSVGKNDIISACMGDSGGPFVCKEDNRWVLQGIVSWGSYKCSASHMYSVFTRVSKYVNWIKTQKKRLRNT